MYDKLGLLSVSNHVSPNFFAAQMSLPSGSQRSPKMVPICFVIFLAKLTRHVQTTYFYPLVGNASGQITVVALRVGGQTHSRPSQKVFLVI